MDRLPFNQGEATPNIDYRNVAKLASSNAKPQGRRSSGPVILIYPAWNRKLKLEGSSCGSPPRVNERSKTQRKVSWKGSMMARIAPGSLAQIRPA